MSLVKYGFSVYAPDGSFAFSKNIEVPEGSQPVVRDVDFDTGGSVVVAASAEGGTLRFSYGHSASGSHRTANGLHQHRRYLPAAIAIASDHSIWTLGSQMAADRPPSSWIWMEICLTVREQTA
jgi:hypothetical protein